MTFQAIFQKASPIFFSALCLSFSSIANANPSFPNTAVKADIELTIGEKVYIEGRTHANEDVFIGRYADIFGQVEAREGHLSIGHKVYIDGRAEYKGKFVASRYATVTGGIHVDDGDNYRPLPEIPEFTAGGDDVIIERDESVDIEPGSYDALIVEKGGEVEFGDGTYTFNSIYIDNDSTIKWTDGSTDIEILIKDELYVGKNVDTDVDKDEVEAKAIKIYLESDEDVVIRDRSDLYGHLIASNAHVKMRLKSKLDGSIHGKLISLAREVTVIGRPFY